MEEMELITAFDSVLHLPNISEPEQLIRVVEDVDVFSKDELHYLHGKLKGRR